ncbi:DUF3576 domain-containing protein [Pelagibacterales bacterium SAG-MED29]|nr:DUF3576 domain-containing protein [Pelagibacterales bacterium SAG-MED29]
MRKHLRFFLIVSSMLTILTSCGALKPKKVDTRETSIKGSERSRKNIEEGGGVSLKNVLNRRGGSFEFSSSNPMWRASLEILDFLPLTTVDYSGGMIVSDWYTGESSNESIKISIRFLSNEIRSDSLKIIVHKKKCSENQSCQTKLLNNSKISQELRLAILKKAAALEKEKKKK